MCDLCVKGCGGAVFVRTRKGWGWFFWLVWRRGDDRRDLGTDFERRREGHAGALVLWFVAVYDVAGAAVKLHKAAAG